MRITCSGSFALASEIQVHELEFFGMRESGLNVPQSLKRPNHQAGTDQQHQRQRHLNDHQGVARAMPFPALADGPPTPPSAAATCAPAYFSTGIRPNSRPANRETPSVNASTEGIDSDFGQTRQRRGTFGDQDSNGGVRQPQAQNAAEDSQGQAFDQHFARDSPPAGAERGPDRQFLLAAFGAHQQQIRDVRAGDQQHQPDGSHQHPQHRPDVSHDFLLQRLELGSEARILKNSADRIPAARATL